jgi:hypothetical protein
VGTPELDAEDWISSIQWLNLSNDHPLKTKFVSILKDWNETEEGHKKLKQLLRYVTGLNALPFGGFQILTPKFTIRQYDSKGSGRLKASTCEHLLLLPGDVPSENLETLVIQ